MANDIQSSKGRETLPTRSIISCNFRIDFLILLCKIKAMYQRLLKPSHKHSYFLFGPRGTGKTLWVKTNYPNSIYLDLLEASLFNDLLAYPDHLENYIPTGFRDFIIIDEIQRIPPLLNEIHRLMEKHDYRFLMTGSSARSLRKFGANLLGGRATLQRMHPLAALEIGTHFRLEKALHYGLMPAIWDKIEDPTRYLQGYVEVYLHQEIAQEGLLRQLGDFARFLKIATFSQGQPLNIANVSREVSLSRERVQGYFQILEDLLISCMITPFTKRATRRLVMHPKFYLFDAGLYRTLRPQGPLDTPEESDGATLETLLLQNLQAVIDSLHLQYQIHFWRSATGLEVDFILYGNHGFHAIEVKRSSTISKNDLKALLAFQEDYPEAKLWFLYGGQHIQYFDKIQAIPFNQFMMQLDQLIA